MRILVLEDDPDLRRTIAWRLRTDGFAVDEAGRMDEADRAARVHRYDCMVVDRRVPDGDALDLVKRWRGPAGIDAMVLILTARDAPAERVEGLDAADDYLTKPFGLDELAARVGALCRRGIRPRPPVVRIGDLEVDRPAREVRRDGVLLTLTRKEFAILEVLVDAEGAVVSAEELFERCWDQRVDPVTRSVTVHLSTLRRKLGDPPLIRTVRGTGYAIEAPRG
ncbi:MAG TPA: response regulator transcription factor [Acidimicrobiales bacterium]|jgi:two-component system copper resistance phosphate regulon response regulator CusR|nr:response regulator transcription factor [Acidimicrobiales bacterium]